MSGRVKINLGDCYRIHLPNGKWAYGQFVHRNADYGDMVRIFDHITSEPLASSSQVHKSDLLFPPVFVGLVAALRPGRWQIIGNERVEEFDIPMFRLTMGTKPGTYHDWRIWDGTKTISLGSLPKDLRSLELKCVWGCEALAERIVAGSYRGNRMF